MLQRRAGQNIRFGISITRVYDDDQIPIELKQQGDIGLYVSG
jgi:hypothetical protein